MTPKSYDGMVEAIRSSISWGLRGQNPRPGDEAAQGRTSQSGMPLLREKLIGKTTHVQVNALFHADLRRT